MQLTYIVVFLLLLLDSISANVIAWTGESKWYAKHFPGFWRLFPVTKGWAVYYLILVLWMGVILYATGVFGF